MTTQRLLGRRHSTPVRPSTSSRPGSTLPSDVLGQTCRRVGTASVVFATLWIITLLVNNVVSRWLGGMVFLRDLWPYPGVIVAGIGVISSIVMTRLAHTLSGRPILLDVGSGYMEIGRAHV